MDGGMRPVRWLCDRLRPRSASNCPIESGISPLKLLLDTSKITIEVLYQ
ncbi:hypothetical protein BVRB_7g167710 [Beta vulgaris subsp. vulgaris]|nr:hypothetical protein BVRB_7g167710 [Beta vulgaris subsp. vulgaris]